MWQEHLKNTKAGLISGGPADSGLPPLLCVHGSGGRAAEFAPLLEELWPHAQAAAIDLPGHGDSPDPGRDDVWAYANWLAGFLAAGPARPVVLGHSLGGAICLALALTRPELARGLVLWGSGARLKVLPAILEGLRDDFGPTVKMVAGLAYAKGADPELVKSGENVMAASRPGVMLGDYSACDKFDVMARLGEIDLPALAVVGDGDRLTPLKYSQYLADHMPDCRLAVLPGAGHMLHHEQPALGAAAVLEFLRGL